MHNKEVERKDLYEHNQLKETESRFNDLLRESQHPQHDSTDLHKKYEEETDRPGFDKNDHRVNEMFQDSSHLPYSTNTRRTTTTSGSAYKYLPSSEPATKNYTSYEQHDNDNRPHSAFTESHVENDYKHHRPKTAGTESKSNTMSYINPLPSDMFTAGRKRYSLHNNQLYVYESDSNSWHPVSGFNT